MQDNINLFEECTRFKEPYVDSFYSKQKSMVISSLSNDTNKLMKANKVILDNITAYSVALESKNVEMQQAILYNIVLALNVSGVNLTEFVNYWATKDMSYSIYKNILASDTEKIEFLKSIIPSYLKERDGLYKQHGYSFSTLQVVADSKAHKENGSSGNKKVSSILDSFGFEHFHSTDEDLFDKASRVYICPDKDSKGSKNKILFTKILQKYGIRFEWSKNHQSKQTDFLIKINNKIYIVEHKHMKESGGGQDKQMSEIIDFISYSENNKNISYISFLDGVYFNLLSKAGLAGGKPFEQKKSILENLMANENNYFVNTFGFKKLIQENI
jgi:DpnII restriction endonuclease